MAAHLEVGLTPEMIKVVGGDLAHSCVEEFLKALCVELFPHPGIGLVFGVDENDPVGRSIYEAWRALHARGAIEADDVVDALCRGELPQWFAGATSPATDGLLAGTRWDDELQGRIHKACALGILDGAP